MDRTTRTKIIKLRSEGYTYTEIQEKIARKVPKSTLSYICKGIILNKAQKVRIATKINQSLIFARTKSSVAAGLKRRERIDRLLQKNLYLGKIIQRTDIAKIALTMLFLGEGSKTHTATVMFGNSNPSIIALFLGLLRKCYEIEEEKFRCTVQCRVGQNSEELKKFWSKVTKIPLKQFYKTQVDPRTAGKLMKKPDYKGVCRIDYLSTEIVCDLHQSIKAIEIAGL